MKKDFLKAIVEHKKKEIAEYKKVYPEKNLIADAEKSNREKRPFQQALKKSEKFDINIIAEIKRASPSKGNIRLDLDAGVYAKAYQKAGAAAVSVLTDSDFFKGSFQDFVLAKNNTSIPILRKDFIISSYQIFQSAALLKADAILLIAAILSKEQLKDYISLTDQLGMKALVEIYSEKDLDAANFAKAKIIGINNRNLRTFETDTEHAVRLVSMLDKDIIPVAASGIRNKKDIQKSLKFGLYNFLIGEALVRADHPETLLKKLLGKNDG